MMIGAIVAKQRVRTAFSYFNDRNMDRFLSLWDEDATFTYPGTLSVSGTSKGKTAIANWFNNLMDSGPTVRFSLKSICVENIFDLIGTNVITAEWENRVTSRKGVERLVKGISVIRIKFGKIVEVCDYILDLESLPLVWGEER